MKNECEALPGVAYPGVRNNRSTINTKTGYDDDDDECSWLSLPSCQLTGEWKMIPVNHTIDSNQKSHICIFVKYSLLAAM